VNALVDVLGEETAFVEELHHRQEHSLELSTVWLHHAVGGRPIEIVPILCGYFVADDAFALSAETLERVDSVLNVLADRLKGRRTVVVAGADLAHVGPTFGDPFPLDDAARVELTRRDMMSLNVFCSGDADSFFRDVHADSDARRICGISPMYLMLRYLGRVSDADLVSYEQCPADYSGGSVVSIAGALLYE
jgi:AmmeMemoRadiSam system protein B